MKLSTLPLVVCFMYFAFPAHAQLPGTYMSGLIQHHHPLPAVLPKNNTPGKSTATMSRLIASAFRDHYQSPIYVLSDTTRFFFSGTNTAEYYTYPKSFDSCRRQQFGTMLVPGPDTQTKVVQVLDVDGHILVSYDVVCNSNFTTLDTMGSTAYVYDNNGNKIEEYFISLVSDTMSRTLYTYDNNDNLLTSTPQSYVQGNWMDAGDKFSYSYTNSNHVDTIRAQTWNNGWENVGLYTYLYNTNDSATSFREYIWDAGTSSYLPFSRYNISYSNDACPILGILEYYQGQAWELSMKRSSSYFPGTCNFHRDSVFYWDNTMNSLLFEIFNRYENYVAAAKPGEWYQYVFTTPGIPEQFAMTAFTYNAYDQLTIVDGRRWDNVTNSAIIDENSILTHYYYEEYEGLDTKPITTAAVEAIFYPIPASDKLNVSLRWHAPQAFTISICDMMGKVIRTFTGDAKEKYSATLDLSGISTGNYLIIISGTSERIVRKFSVEGR